MVAFGRTIPYPSTADPDRRWPVASGHRNSSRPRANRMLLRGSGTRTTRIQLTQACPRKSWVRACKSLPPLIYKKFVRVEARDPVQQQVARRGHCTDVLGQREVPWRQLTQVRYNAF